MQLNRPIPWYKQFWPWFLIAVPTSSFIVGFIVINLAVNTSDSLVDDDYYKEGKAINQKIQRQELAKTLGISTLLSVNNGSISLEFVSGKPTTGEALQLQFQHSTINSRDFSLILTQDASGIYRAITDAETDGKWRVTLTPMDQSWKVRRVVGLPQSAPIKLEP